VDIRRSQILHDRLRLNDQLPVTMNRYDIADQQSWFVEQTVDA